MYLYRKNREDGLLERSIMYRNNNEKFLAA